MIRFNTKEDQGRDRDQENAILNFFLILTLISTCYSNFTIVFNVENILSTFNYWQRITFQSLLKNA